jgi:hypothetical protein
LEACDGALDELVCAAAPKGIAGIAARSNAGVAASKKSLKLRFTANLPKKEIPCAGIESQIAEKVAGYRGENCYLIGIEGPAGVEKLLRCGEGRQRAKRTDD